MEEEVFQDILGFEGIYKIGNFGNVKSIKYKRLINRNKDYFLKGVKNTKGYLQVRLYKDKKAKVERIHRLVAEVFVNNPKNLKQINHKNGDKTDNHYKNLEWCTNLYNQRHSWKFLGRKGRLGKKNKRIKR